MGTAVADLDTAQAMFAQHHQNRGEELTAIFVDHRQSLYRIAMRWLENHADAEDALQDAFLSAYTHLDQFKRQARMSTWVTTIVINSARMKLRRRPRQVLLALSDQSQDHDSEQFLEAVRDRRPAQKRYLKGSDTYPQVVADKRARRRLDKRWRTAFENAAIGIVMADFNGRYFAANSAFRNMLGYTERELYRLSFDEVTYEGDREANVLLVSELTEGKRQHFEIEKRYCRKDGTLLWARQHVALVPGMQGEAPFWFGVVEDITGRKHVDEELRLHQHHFRESEARLQAFFENSPNLVFIKDREGRYLYVNREFKKVLCVADEQVIGKRDDELFSAEHAAAFQANDRQALQAGVPMEFEETALEEDGQHTSIVHKFPLFSAEGEIYAIGGIVTDITERKKEESARRFSEERYRILVETANDAVLSADETGLFPQVVGCRIRIPIILTDCQRRWTMASREFSNLRRRTSGLPSTR